MSERRLLQASERWLGLLLHLYPVDFRDEMGRPLVETYRDRCRHAMRRGGALALAGVWLRATADSVRNGIAERAQPGIRWRRSGNWGRDTERVLRRLARAPLFVLTLLATMTVGLGAFAVVYTVVDKVLIEPLPYERPDDLYFVWRDYSKLFDLKRGWVAGTDVVALDTARGPILDVAGLRRVQYTLTDSAAAGGGADPTEIGVMISSPNLFSLLGVRPILGRGFAPDEAGPERPARVVLSHDLWRSHFGADRGIVGRQVRLNGTPYDVIGVMGPDFHFVRHSSLGQPEGADAWTTFNIDLASTRPGEGSYAAILRARAGTAPQQVEAAVAAVGRMTDVRDHKAKGVKLYSVGLKPDLVSAVKPAITVLGAAGVVLVLVLAVNLATLLLVRAAQRDREFAISRALGANPLALVRATVLEAAFLGLAGGACAALAAWWGTRALVAIAPADLPRRDAIAMDWQIAAVVIGVGLLLGLLAGIAPATWVTRARLSSLLSSAAVRGGGGGHGPLRRGMVVLQVALSLVLLSAAGLVARSFERLLRADPGFKAEGVLTLRVPAPAMRYPNDTVRRQLHERIERELAAIPGVQSVGATSALPFTGGPNQSSASMPGAPGNTGDPEHDEPLVDWQTVRAGYFSTLGIRVLEGRTFSPAPPSPGTSEVVIDRTLAERFYPGGGVIGRKLHILSDSVIVIGVVQHARQYDVHADGRPEVYVRDEDITYGGQYYVLRTDRPAESLAREVRAVVHRIDPQLAVSDLMPMEDVVNETLRQPRVSAVLLAGFSLGALLLSAMGLFGVVAGTVSHRRHELAVRLALGADHSRVLRMVLGDGARLILLGILLGVPGIWLSRKVVAGMLVGISPGDPATIAAVASVLGAVALLACWIPARRVTRIEPARSLREG